MAGTILDESTIPVLRGRFEGDLLEPGDDGYDEALEQRVDEVYGAKYDFTPDSSGESDPWFVVRPKRAYAWTERDYTRSATQYDFG